MCVKYKFYKRVTGRAAQAVCAAASRTANTILITKDDRTVNAASLIGLLSLCIREGEEVGITVHGGAGTDEQSVLDNFIRELKGL